MYFVDRKKIEETLLYMESLLKEVESQNIDSFKDRLFLERAVELIIESMLDVGNMMIDGFIMRDPGSFEDIIDILLDEEVLPQKDESGYKAIIQLRKKVVKDYLTVDHAVLSETIKEHYGLLEQFAPHIRHYLDNELGTVANAFSNE